MRRSAGRKTLRCFRNPIKREEQKTKTESDKRIKCELFHDNFQNFKRYGIPKAQMVIADIPYNIGKNFYGSNPMWYKNGDNKNGESKLAKKQAFNSDFNFNIVEFFHFCNRLLKKEPNKSNGRGKSSDAPCMLVFCSFEQIPIIIQTARDYGFHKNQHLTFIKNYSPQVLKANMRICGATEHAILLYRNRLPKFRNDRKMIFDWFEWERDNKKDYPKIHPTQKPVKLLKRLISIYTDPGDVIVDPCAGSGATLRAAYEIGRNSYGFEIDKNFYQNACSKMLALKDLYKKDEIKQECLFDLEEIKNESLNSLRGIAGGL